MSYQVIARKYRPQKFSDVVGQEHVTQTLTNAIQQNRIAHAYIFVGPRGTGKTTIARIFAKCLNCTDGPRVDFPDDDPRAQEITEGRSLDVMEIDGASNRGIDEIRDLREKVKYAPANSKFKIYIIDEVHMLTKDAFNALLKTLEEPPAHVKFMFATTEADKVLPTILSRCQRFDLRGIPMGAMVKHLAWIAEQENIVIEPGAVEAIARGADGGLRDAESTLDQLISFCGSNIVESDVLSMFGLAGRGQVLAMAEAILAGDAAGVLHQFHGLLKSGKDMGRLLGDLLQLFRNVLIHQISGGDRNLIELPETEFLQTAALAQGTNATSLSRVMEVLSEGESRLNGAVSKKILFEVLLLKAIEARNAVPLETVLAQLQQWRQSSGSPTPPLTGSTPSEGNSPRTAQPSRPVRQPAAPSTPSVPQAIQPTTTPTAIPTAPTEPKSETTTPLPAATVAAPVTPGESGQKNESLELLWSQLVEAVGRASAFTKTYLLEAHPVSLDHQVLTIGFDPEFDEHRGLVDTVRNHTLLQTKLQELGHPRTQVRFVKAEAPPHWVRLQIASSVGAHESELAATISPAKSETVRSSVTNGSASTSTPTPSISAKPKLAAPVVIDPGDFKNDPLILKALELFKGTIVDVRL